MKIAVMYSGHLRTWDFCRTNQEHCFINDDCDLYFYTYSKPENTRIKQFIKIPGTYYTEAIHDYDSNKNPITCTDNTLQAWHNLFVGFCLIPQDYDVYVKSRCDIILTEKIDFARFEMNDTDIYIPSENDHCGGVNDQFAFGSYSVMKKYYSVYLNHLKLFQEGHTFHTEYYVTQNLLKQGVNIKRLSVVNHIIRENDVPKC